LVHSADRPDLRGIFVDSFRLAAFEHIGRLTFQEKTRAQLGGPFWRDYLDSTRMPRQWGDTDRWPVNYVGHPIHGAAAGFIWIQNDPRGRGEDIGLSAAYWASRGKAAAWITAYSLQFEVGPFSEASLGNVGKRPETTVWVDHVITPLGGLGMVIAEDAIDRWFIRWIEDRTGNRALRALSRSLLNPSRALANVSDLRPPWHRRDRPLRGTP
jgi:hypothetical protein